MATTSATHRSRKPAQAKKPAFVRHKPLHVLMPWHCEYFGDRSEIKAYIMATGKWEVVARVEQTAGIDAAATANFIVNAVNDYERMQNLITELAAALEPCLACDGLNWETEYVADAVLARVRQEGLAK